MNAKFSESRLLSFLFRYGVAILLVGSALILTLLIWTFIKSFASPLFFLAIIVSAWNGGIRAGILATFLSGISINYFFITPEFQISGETDDFFRLLIFMLEGSFLCWLITWRTKAAEEIKNSREQLQALSLRQQTLIENERQRIALEIHDELGQSLTGLKMEIHLLNKQFLENAKDSNNAEINHKIKELLQLIDTTIASVRRISTDLRPPILDDLGLVAAIEWQAREFQRRTGIPCVLTTNIENPVLDSEFSIAFFRVFQETLTNIARHANAKNVEIKLERLNQILALRVKDNGKGFQTQNPIENHSLGILGMRERARLIGGELKVFDALEGGTIVELTAPLK